MCVCTSLGWTAFKRRTTLQYFSKCAVSINLHFCGWVDYIYGEILKMRMVAKSGSHRIQLQSLDAGFILKDFWKYFIWHARLQHPQLFTLESQHTLQTTEKICFKRLFSNFSDCTNIQPGRMKVGSLQCWYCPSLEFRRKKLEDLRNHTNAEICRR